MQWRSVVSAGCIKGRARCTPKDILIRTAELQLSMDSPSTLTGPKFHLEQPELAGSALSVGHTVVERLGEGWWK